MKLQQAVKTCFSKYVDFTGRASRSEYWWFVLTYVVLVTLSSYIDIYVYYIVVLAFLLPLLAVGARRLHDAGKSAWWLLISVIPLLGGLVLLFFTVQPSEPAANAYGAPPVT